jgi:hypothetical protein
VVPTEGSKKLSDDGRLLPKHIDIRTTWVTTKSLVLTYDQSLELRLAWRS